MELGELGRMAEEENELERDRWIGVYIGFLAVLLALCAMGGSGANKDANRFNIEASDAWAFFQAKSERRTQFTIAADALELRLKTEPQMPAAERTAMDALAKDYRATVQRLTSDGKEGTAELSKKAHGLEEERDVALHKGPYFEYAEALLQVAIVLASVAIITGMGLPLIGSVILAAGGAFLLADGYFMFVNLPFLG